MFTQTRIRSASAIVLLTVLLLPGLWSCTVKKISSAGIEAVQIFERWRGQVEAHAKSLKAAYQAPTDQYKEAERRYIGAETKANVLIDRILHALSNNVDPTASPVYEDTIETAVGKALAFMAYRTEISNSSEPIINRQTLTEATARLWQEYAKAPTVRREAIRAELRRLKWRPFQEL